MIDKPKLSVKITALNLVEGETELRSKTYDKTNGLMSLTVSGVSNDAPHYGIISRAGTVEIVDKPEIIDNEDGSTNVEYWLEKQSNDNVLPDVIIDIFINGSLQYSFTSENEISYTIQDRRVTIELTDEVEALQDRNLETDLIYENVNALTIWNDLVSIMQLPVIIDKNTTEYLQNVILPTNILLTNDIQHLSGYNRVNAKVLISADTYWNIIQQFTYGINAIFYKLGETYYLKRMRE